MKLFVALCTLAAATIPTSSAFVSTSTTSANRRQVFLFGALHNVEAGVGARNSFGARLVDYSAMYRPTLMWCLF